MKTQAEEMLDFVNESKENKELVLNAVGDYELENENKVFLKNRVSAIIKSTKQDYSKSITTIIFSDDSMLMFDEFQDATIKGD